VSKVIFGALTVDQGVTEMENSINRIVSGH